MNDAPESAVATATPAPEAAAPPAPTSNGHGRGGVIARGEREAAEAIAAALADLGFGPRPVDLRPLPFEGTWGLATSAAYGLANEAVTRELEASGQLRRAFQEGSQGARRGRGAGARAASWPSRSRQRVAAAGNPLFASVEAVNGYVNIAFDSNAVAAALIGEVLERGPEYGQGAADRRDGDGRALPTEYAQGLPRRAPAELGARRRDQQYPARRRVRREGRQLHRRHRHARRQVPLVLRALPPRRGAGQRRRRAAAGWGRSTPSRTRGSTSARTCSISCSCWRRKISSSSTAIDRMLKYLWRQGRRRRGYRLPAGADHPRAADQGRAAAPGRRHPHVLADRRRPAPRPRSRPPKPYVPVEGDAGTDDDAGGAAGALGIARRAHGRVVGGRRHGWREEVRETFARWEAQEPEFVALWQTTRDWSMADFRRIFAELGATFDVWFFESEVEEEGKRIVEDLLQRGIAEISEGLPVVKIDEKLGLTEPTYRTLPILRSDGSYALLHEGPGADEAKVRGVRRRPRHLGGRRPAVALFPADLQDPGAVGLRSRRGRPIISATRWSPAGGRHLLPQGERPRLRRRARRGAGAGARDHRGEEPRSAGGTERSRWPGRWRSAR